MEVVSTAPNLSVGKIFHGSGGDRTPDLLLAEQALSQTELPTQGYLFQKESVRHQIPRCLLKEIWCCLLSQALSQTELSARAESAQSYLGN